MRADVPLLFDVYVSFQGQCLQYKKNKEQFEATKLQLFSAKKIKKVYIKPEDESHYLTYLDQALNDLKDEKITVTEKASLAQESIATEAENIQKNLDTEEGYKSTQNRMEKIIDFVTTDPNALKNMLATAGLSADNSAHSSTVASMAMAVASRAGLTDAQELMAISISALLHDLGIAKLGFDPMVQRENIPKDQIAKWRKHPEETVNMVAGKRYITPRVLRIIADHHEIGEGIGFPERKKIKKLPLSSQIFNLCDEFDHYCVLKQLDVQKAFDSFVEEKSEHFDLKHLEILEKLLKT